MLLNPKANRKINISQKTINLNDDEKEEVEDEKINYTNTPISDNLFDIVRNMW